MRTTRCTKYHGEALSQNRKEGGREGRGGRNCAVDMTRMPPGGKGTYVRFIPPVARGRAEGTEEAALRTTAPHGQEHSGEGRIENHEWIID